MDWPSFWIGFVVAVGIGILCTVSALFAVGNSTAAGLILGGVVVVVFIFGVAANS